MWNKKAITSKVFKEICYEKMINTIQTKGTAPKWAVPFSPTKNKHSRC